MIIIIIRRRIKVKQIKLKDKLDTLRVSSILVPYFVLFLGHLNLNLLYCIQNTEIRKKLLKYLQIFKVFFASIIYNMISCSGFHLYSFLYAFLIMHLSRFCLSSFYLMSLLGKRCPFRIGFMWYPPASVLLCIFHGS